MQWNDFLVSFLFLKTKPVLWKNPPEIPCLKGIHVESNQTSSGQKAERHKEGVWGKKGCLMMIDQHKVVNNYKWSKIYHFVYFVFFFLETLWITLCMIRAVTCLVLVFTFLLIRPELILCKTNFHCSYSCKSLGDMSLSESNFCSLFCAK